MAVTMASARPISDQIAWLRYATTMAFAKELVMVARRRPQCAKRAMWVVWFDRCMEQGSRAMDLDLCQS